MTTGTQTRHVLCVHAHTLTPFIVLPCEPQKPMHPGQLLRRLVHTVCGGAALATTTYVCTPRHACTYILVMYTLANHRLTGEIKPVGPFFGPRSKPRTSDLDRSSLIRLERGIEEIKGSSNYFLRFIL